MCARTFNAAQQLASAGGKARAAKLSPAERRAIARTAAAARWEEERRSHYFHLPTVRLAAAEYFALPTKNPLTGALWRCSDDYGRLLVIEPDAEMVQLGLKFRPILRLPVTVYRYR